MPCGALDGCRKERDARLMRRAARIDDNQNQVVDDLRKAGCEVFITSALGNGFPDLVVKRERLLLVELKDPSKVPSARKLTPDEEEFARRFDDSVIVAETAAEILDALRAPTRDDQRWSWLACNCFVGHSNHKAAWHKGSDEYGNIINLRKWIDQHTARKAA